MPLQRARWGTIATAIRVTTSAGASGGAGGRGDTGGKGGAGPPSAGAGESGTQSDTGISAADTFQPLGAQYQDLTEHRPRAKPWELVADFETHRLLQDNYLAEGVGKVKLFNVLDVAGYYFVTPDDRIRLEVAAFQYFLADSGESGFRADDVELEYSHVFHLPSALALRASAGLTAPLSFASQLQSNITAPFAKLRLARTFGDFVVSAGVSARYYIDRYSSANSLGAAGQDSGSGQPNLQFITGASLSAEYNLPFYRPIAIGASVADFYMWFYDVGTCPYQSMCYGATSDPQFGNGQPVQESYGGDVFVRFIMPELGDFKGNMVLTLANGDPTLGYPTMLDDGMQHPYFLYYNTAEVYLALEGSY